MTQLSWDPDDDDSDNEPFNKLTDIYLLFADLVKLRKSGFTSFSGPGAPLLRPSKHPFFSTFLHWAIQVRGIVYEVTADDYGIPLDKQQFNVKVSSIREWTKRRDRHELRYEKIKLGLTKYSDKQMARLAHLIWETRFKVHPKSYDLNKQNCQNFAFLLYETSKIQTVKQKSRSRGKRRKRRSRSRNTNSSKSTSRSSGGYSDSDSDRDKATITIPKQERDSWKPFPVRYTEYVQLGKVIRESPALLAGGSALLSVAGKLAGPEVTGSVKELAKGLVMGMGATETFLVVGLAASFLAVTYAEKRSRDYLWLKKMKREALAIVEEAEKEHVI